MSTSTFSSFSSTFGFIIAATSLLVHVIQICRSHLPSNKIKVLESQLEETDTCFKEAVEDGLLTELSFVRQTECRLATLRSRTNDLRSRVYNATNLGQDFIEFFRGTSTAIGTTCRALKKLRAQVITTSEEGRRQRESHSPVPSPHYASPPTLPIYSEAAARPNPIHADEIPRPSSCPPSLPAWTLADARRAFTHNNPSREPAGIQSDSDVRTADAQSRALTVHTSVTLEPGA